MTSTTNDTALMIDESVRRIFESNCTPARLKDAEGNWDEVLWRELQESGFTRALEPADKSTLEIAVPDALSIVRLAGAHAAPVPLVENMLSHWLLQRAGISCETEALTKPVSIAPVNAGDKIELQRTANGWRLRGKLTRVPWGRHAAALAVAASAQGESLLVCLPSSGYTVTACQENLAREPRDQIDVDAELPPAAVAPLQGGVQYAYALGAAMRVLQMAGALDGVLSLTVRYAEERQQFGRPIGKFQAIQQNVAIMAANIAAARASANSVVRIISDDGSPYGIAAAKVRTNEAATIAARTSHQVHGAMGFTQEYPLHFLTKRLWSWRDEFGNETEWSRYLGRAVCSRGADHLWEFITAEIM